MNKRTKLVVSLLFVVIIILAAAVTRFYSAVPDEVIGGVNQPDISRRLETNSDKYTIFENGSSLCGILDSRDRVIVAPEWLTLSFAGENACTASKRIGGKVLSGCIDYEGNITVPFIYSTITRHQKDTQVFYIAEADADGQFVIYDADFRPAFRQSWTGAKYTDGKLILVDKGGIFTYSFGSGGLVFENAKVSGETLGCAYTMEVDSGILLQKLTSQMLEKIVSDTGAYLEYAFTGDDDLLSQLGNRTGFQQLYPEDHKILEKKLKSINEIYVYNVRLEDGSPGFAVAVKADAEITYSDENDGELKTLNGFANAKVTFTGTNLNDLSAAAGSFKEQQPDYPKPEPPPAPEYDPETGELLVPLPTAADDMPVQQEAAQPDGEMFYQQAEDIPDIQ